MGGGTDRIARGWQFFVCGKGAVGLKTIKTYKSALTLLNSIERRLGNSSLDIAEIHNFSSDLTVVRAWQESAAFWGGPTSRPFFSASGAMYRICERYFLLFWAIGEGARKRQILAFPGGVVDFWGSKCNRIWRSIFKFRAYNCYAKQKSVMPLEKEKKN